MSSLYDCTWVQRQHLKHTKKNSFKTKFEQTLTLTEMKLVPLSLATALANKVLPHPGGP